jgi:hypothetical protein
MAISNSSQILIDTNKRTVIKRIGILDSDENPTVIINPKTLFGALNANGALWINTAGGGNTVAPGFANSAFTIHRIIAAVDAEVGHLQLQWEGTTTTNTIIAMGVGVLDSNPQSNLPAITNNATGPTGNVLIKTVGTTANAAYTVIIELHKDSRYYSAGQFQDPAAFNYPPYNLTP